MSQQIQKISLITSILCMLFGICEIILTYYYYHKIVSCDVKEITFNDWLICNGFIIIFICIYDIIYRTCCHHFLKIYRIIQNILIIINIGWLIFGIYIYIVKCNHTIKIQNIIYITMFIIYFIKLFFNLFVPIPKHYDIYENIDQSYYQNNYYQNHHHHNNINY